MTGQARAVPALRPCRGSSCPYAGPPDRQRREPALRECAVPSCSGRPPRDSAAAPGRLGRPDSEGANLPCHPPVAPASPGTHRGVPRQPQLPVWRQQVRRRGPVLQVAVEDVGEGPEFALPRGVPDRVDGVLRLPERELRVAGVAVAQLSDPVPCRYAPPQGGGAGHDLRVIPGV